MSIVKSERPNIGVFLQRYNINPPEIDELREIATNLICSVPMSITIFSLLFNIAVMRCIDCQNTINENRG